MAEYVWVRLEPRELLLLRGVNAIARERFTRKERRLPSGEFHVRKDALKRVRDGGIAPNGAS